MRPEGERAGLDDLRDQVELVTADDAESLLLSPTTQVTPELVGGLGAGLEEPALYVRAEPFRNLQGVAELLRNPADPERVTVDEEDVVGLGRALEPSGLNARPFRNRNPPLLAAL